MSFVLLILNKLSHKVRCSKFCLGGSASFAEKDYHHMASVYKLEKVGTNPSGLQGYRTRCLNSSLISQSPLSSVFIAKITKVGFCMSQAAPDQDRWTWWQNNRLQLPDD